METVPALSGEGAGQLDDTRVVDLLGRLSGGNVVVADLDGELTLAGL